MKKIILVTFFIISQTFAKDQKVADDVQSIYENVLENIEENDYESFIKLCNKEMKAAMTKEVISSVSQQLSTSDESTSNFLCKVKRAGMYTYYWSVDMDSDEEYDLIVEMTLDSDDLVAGINIW